VQIPGYKAAVDALKSIGIDEVIVYCVNDGAVMEAWAKDQGTDTTDFITFMGDPHGLATKEFGIELTHPGPLGKGLVNRCKRTATYYSKGVAEIVRVAEKPDDPAGDDFPDVTLAEAMITAIEELNLKSEL